MKYRAACLVFLAASTLSADTYDTLLHRYEKQIRRQEKQLEELRNRLVEKEKEADQWQEKSEAARTQWMQAGAVVEKTRLAVQDVRDRLRKSKALADAAESSATESALMSHSADDQLAMLTRELYAARVAPVASDASPDAQVLTAYVLDHMTAYATTARGEAQQAISVEATLRTEEMQLQNREARQSVELEHSHEKQRAEWLRWQEASRKKAALEDEKTQMEQSAEALRVMVQELRDHRDHTLAARQGKPGGGDDALASLRGTLPWPAEGTVTQTFGRQFSNELQQLLVSNGIKILAGPNHSVRAVDAGKVLFAQPFHQYGQLVIVQHAHGLTSVYGSLGSTRVKEGDHVQSLDVIGSAADNGSFYFELRHDEQPVNPLVYLVPSHRTDLSSRRKYQ